jgi:hypothetical protein
MVVSLYDGPFPSYIFVLSAFSSSFFSKKKIEYLQLMRLESGFRNSKKQIINKTNDITERTQRIVLEKFTDEQLAEFKELFIMFDKDNQG